METEGEHPKPLKWAEKRPLINRLIVLLIENGKKLTEEQLNNIKQILEKKNDKKNENEKAT